MFPDVARKCQLLPSGFDSDRQEGVASYSEQFETSS